MGNKYNISMKKFFKNDEGFVCANCGKLVGKLNYSSRDHCTNCLCSIHIDIQPGDRLNSCGGLLIPTEITPNSKKGYVINYTCQKCGKTHNNRTAEDDNFKTILKVMNKTYNYLNFKK